MARLGIQLRPSPLAGLVPLRFGSRGCGVACRQRLRHAGDMAILLHGAAPDEHLLALEGKAVGVDGARGCAAGGQRAGIALVRYLPERAGAGVGKALLPARTPGLKLNDNAPLALAQRKHHDIAASQAALAVGDNLVAPPQIHDQAKDKGMVESFRFLASPGPLTFRFTCIGSIGVAAPLSDLS